MFITFTTLLHSNARTLVRSIGAKYGGAGGASAPPALSDRSAGGARWCKY